MNHFFCIFFSIAQIYFDSCLQLNPPDSIFPWFKQSWDLSDFLCLDVVLCWSTDLILSAVVVIMELTPRKKKKEKKKARPPVGKGWNRVRRSLAAAALAWAGWHSSFSHPFLIYSFSFGDETFQVWFMPKGQCFRGNLSNIQRVGFESSEVKLRYVSYFTRFFPFYRSLDTCEELEKLKKSNS